jgi:hypothetical protein
MRSECEDAHAELIQRVSAVGKYLRVFSSECLNAEQAIRITNAFRAFAFSCGAIKVEPTKDEPRDRNADPLP